jgi:hypothetical protein
MSQRKRSLFVSLTGLFLLMGYHFETFQGARLDYLNTANGIALIYNDDRTHQNNNNSTNNSSNTGRNKLTENNLLKGAERSTTSSHSTTITPSPYANNDNISNSTNNNSTTNNSTNNSSSSGSDKLNEADFLKWIEGFTTSSSSTTIAPSPHSNSSNNNHTAQQQVLATILVQLRGELGNHLSVWSHAKGLQLQLSQDYGITADLVLRHQVLGHSIHGTRLNPKGKPTASKFQQCFPNLRSQPTFGSANTEYFLKRYTQQADWLKNKTGTLLSQVHQRWLLDLSRVNGRPVNAYETMSDDDIHAGLTAFDQLLRLPPTQKPITTTTSTSTTIQPTSSTVQDPISIPFLYVTALNNNYMWNRYYDEFRNYFAFDDTACCKAIPEPDETVFVRCRSVGGVCLWIYVRLWNRASVQPRKLFLCLIVPLPCRPFCIFAFCIRGLVDPLRLLCFILVHLFNNGNPNKNLFDQTTHILFLSGSIDSTFVIIKRK